MTNAKKIDIGSIQIHKDVIEEIIYNATKDIEGVYFPNKPFYVKLIEIFGQKRYPGIWVFFKNEQDISVEVKVYIRFGLNIPEMARLIQNTITRSVEESINIPLNHVNINILGVEKRGRS